MEGRGRFGDIMREFSYMKGVQVLYIARQRERIPKEPDCGSLIAFTENWTQIKMNLTNNE